MNVYGYIRVSTATQARSGLSLAAQTRQIQQFAKSLGRKPARIFRDAAFSASRTAFLRRPAGRELDRVMMKGDHIVIAKLDRAFRSLQDFAFMLDRWQRRGVLVHMLDINIDTSTPSGRLIAGIIASVAEWESRRIGERIRDAHDERRRQGRKTNGTVPIGFRAVRKRVLPDRREREIARSIWRMRQAGMTWQAIVERLNANRVPRRVMHRRYRPVGRRKPWHETVAIHWGAAARHNFPITGYHGIRQDRTRSRAR